MLARRFLFTFRKFESNIHQKHNNKQQCCGYLNVCTDIPKIIHFSSSFSNITVASKNIIPNVTELINCKNSIKFLGNEMFDPIKVLANQAAERFMDRPENALSQGRYFFFIKTILTPFKRIGLGRGVK